MFGLAIETSSPTGSVALFRGTTVLASHSHDTPNAHAEQLLPLVDRVVTEAGISRQQLELVAVGLGPGSFTGLRVGIALAQGVSAGLGIAAVGIGSLPNLALSPPELSPSLLYGALLDARRGEYFFAAYDHTGSEVISPRAIPQHDAAQHIRGLVGEAPLVVSGDVVPAQLPVALWSTTAQSYPSASRIPLLLQMGLARDALVPLYLRDADAKLPDLPPNPIAR